MSMRKLIFKKLYQQHLVVLENKPFCAEQAWHCCGIFSCKPCVHLQWTVRCTLHSVGTPGAPACRECRASNQSVETRSSILQSCLPCSCACWNMLSRLSLHLKDLPLPLLPLHVALFTPPGLFLKLTGISCGPLTKTCSELELCVSCSWRTRVW